MARSRSSTNARARLLAALGLGALLGGMAVVALGSDAGGGGGGGAAAPAAVATTQTTTATPVPKPPATVRVVVRGVGAYDPEGDRSENDSQAPFATDGDPSTAWKSEHYRTSFSKSGVGLVLDLGRPVRATRLVLTTDTPGYAAQIRAGNGQDGPFKSVSGSKKTTARTAFALTPRIARYLMVWVTSMPPGGVASVNEVAVAARR